MTRSKRVVAYLTVSGAIGAVALVGATAPPADPPATVPAAVAAVAPLPAVKARLTGPMPEIVVHGAVWPSVAGAAAYRLVVDKKRQADQIPTMCPAASGTAPCATQGFAQPVGCGAAHTWNVQAVDAAGNAGPLMAKPLTIPRRACP